MTILNKHDNCWLEVSTKTEISSKTSLLINSINGFDQYATQEMPRNSEVTLKVSKDNINKVVTILEGKG